MDSISRLRQALKIASENHEELADAREEVLVEREAVRSRAKRVRAQRIRTGDAEASFINQFRKTFLEHASSFPPALAAAYQKVIEERDALGSIEVDYLQVEEDLGAHEWEFTEKENDFYQYGLQELFSEDLLHSLHHIKETQPRTPSPHPPPITTSASSQYQEAIAERDRLLREFDALRPKQAKILDRLETESNQYSDFWEEKQDSAFVNEYSDLLTKIMECDVDIQRLRHESLGIPINRRNSNHVHSTSTSLYFEPIARPLSDGALPNLLESPSVTHRIRAWLLDYLKSNALEKTQYLNILKHTLKLSDIAHFDFASWEDRASRHWGSDLTEHVPLAENDSHISTHVTGQQAASRQLPSPIVLSELGAMHSDKHAFKDAPNVEADFDFLPVSSKMDPQRNDEQTGPMGLPSVVIPSLKSKSPSIQATEQSLEELSVVPSLNLGPGITAEMNALAIPDPEDNQFLDIYQPGQLTIQHNSNNLEAPLSPRCDSCQESDVEESQRLNTVRSYNPGLIPFQLMSGDSNQANRHENSNLASDHASVRHSGNTPTLREPLQRACDCSRSGTDNTTTTLSQSRTRQGAIEGIIRDSRLRTLIADTLDSHLPLPLPLITRDICKILSAPLPKLHLPKCNHTPSRSHSVSGGKTCSRATSSANLSIPIETRHKRTRSTPFSIYLNRGEIAQNRIFVRVPQDVLALICYI